MARPLTVREVRPEEHEALGALTVAAYRALLGEDMTLDYATELVDVDARAAQADVLVAVDDRDQRLLGGITYIPGPGPMAWFDRPDEAGMRMLAVAPEAQGTGVGAALVAACVERARAAGKSRVLLHTIAPMTAAQRLYERLGFHREPERDTVFEEEGLLLLAYAADLGPVGSG
jgi:ribosomal protein S18 acetylase RimI-like enzyme